MSVSRFRLFRSRTGCPIGIAILVCVPTLSAQSRTGEIAIGHEETIYSPILGEERLLRIRLPQNYARDDSRYPVLFVLDSEWDPLFLHAVGTVAIAADAPHVPDLIVVGITNNDRTRDMIPVQIPSRPGSGGASRFLRFLVEELLPSVQSRYRTDSNLLLYGASNAGLFTVFAVLSEPSVFKVGIASSPTIGHCLGFMEDLAADMSRRERMEPTGLFMAYGENDYPQSLDHVVGFHDLLRSRAGRGFTSEVLMFENEGHVPYGSLYQGLRWAFDTSIKLSQGRGRENAHDTEDSESQSRLHLLPGVDQPLLRL